MAIESYFRLDDVKGESQVEIFKNQIQLTSFSLGGANASSVGAGTGSGAGKVDLGPVVMTKQIDSASVALFVAMCVGKHFATATLSVVKAGAGGAYLKLDFRQVFITGYNTGASTEVPTETISMSYRSIFWTYMKQDEMGNLTAAAVGGYDLHGNKKL